MKFSTHEDVEAPIAYVYARVTDFDAFERQAMRRGADVRRADAGGAPMPGSTWDVAFKFRGKDRKMRATLTSLDGPHGLRVDTVASGLDSGANVDLVPLSKQRTRISVSIDLSAKTLSARLLLQSLKLARANLTKRFKTRVAEFAQGIEDGYRRNK